MNIHSILSVASTRLAIIGPDQPFVDAARHFSAGIRMLVVCDATGSAIGVVTRTDAMRHLLAAADPLSAPTAEVMSRPIICAAGSEDLLATWQMMLERGLNHVPVLEPDGKPIAVLTSDDALRFLLQSEQYDERLLSDYVAGIGYR